MSHPYKVATIIGGQGFIGRHLCQTLSEQGWQCYLPQRQAPELTTRDLGHVFYCAGLTADFRQRPFATVEAHVQHLAFVLEHGRFDSLTYLSSTRVYAGASHTQENAVLSVCPDKPSDLYNLSKLMGESLCLNAGVGLAKTKPVVNVVRLSNVFGHGMPASNFLAEVLFEARTTKTVRFRTSPDSEKDYISVSDVVRYLPQIALDGAGGIINVASGQNLSHRELANKLEQAGMTCFFEPDAPTVRFPIIDTQKLHTLYGNSQYDLLDVLPKLLGE